MGVSCIKFAIFERRLFCSVWHKQPLLLLEALLNAEVELRVGALASISSTEHSGSVLSHAAQRAVRLDWPAALTV